MPYSINEPRIAHETIDGETILIDFQSGFYYSARAEAGLIWQKLMEGHDIDHVVTMLVASHATDHEVIHGFVSAFVADLVAREILLDHGSGQTGLGGGASPVAAPSDGPTGSATPTSPLPEFKQPVLEAHTDMQELLLLDPIHETSDEGWPNKK